MNAFLRAQNAKSLDFERKRSLNRDCLVLTHGMATVYTSVYYQYNEEKKHLKIQLSV